MKLLQKIKRLFSIPPAEPSRRVNVGRRIGGRNKHPSSPTTRRIVQLANENPSFHAKDIATLTGVPPYYVLNVIRRWCPNRA